MGKIGVGISPSLTSYMSSNPISGPIADTLNPNPATLLHVVLSESNTVARIPRPGGYFSDSGSARSVSSKITGKYYLEVWRVFDNNVSGYAGFGLSSITPRNAANGAGFTAGFLPRYGPANKTAFAVDFTAGKIWYSSFSGTAQWATGANPETGAVPNVTFTPGGSYCFFLLAYLKQDSYGVVESYSKVNFGASPFLYTKPNGFSIWTQ